MLTTNRASVSNFPGRVQDLDIFLQKPGCCEHSKKIFVIFVQNLIKFNAKGLKKVQIEFQDGCSGPIAIN